MSARDVIAVSLYNHGIAFPTPDEVTDWIVGQLTAGGYRILGQDADDAATTIYGRLLHRHMEAARKDINSQRRADLFDMIEAFRQEFPDECQVWEGRYSPEAPQPEAKEAREDE